MTALLEKPTHPAPHAEAAYTLEEPPPRVLGWWDQIGLWGNLGMSILGPVTAIWILQPATGGQMSYVGAGVAIILGTILRALLGAAPALPGAPTGGASMGVVWGP